MPIKAAINGFGRIGRPTLRILLNSKNIDVVAINDLTDIKTLAHLLKHDSLYGTCKQQISFNKTHLKVGKKKIMVFSEPDPSKLPWKEQGVRIVLESTGCFRDLKGAQKHLQAGAKKVIISAPPKSKSIPTYVLGVNHQKISKKDQIISNGSCTTNCLAPVMKVLNDKFGVAKAIMTTIHSYTNDQRILDLPHKDLRRARAAAQNLIPTTTGAAQSVIEVIPCLKGKLFGMAVRVPSAIVSLIDLTCQLKKTVSIKQINQAFKVAEKGKMKAILATSEEPLVSSDFKGNNHSAIVDLLSTALATNKKKDNLIKVVAWYDNEWAYACRYAEMAEYWAKK